MNNIIILTKDSVPIGFRMEGHAGAFYDGRDLVCAALSVLSQNTVFSISKLSGLLKDRDFEFFEDASLPVYEMIIKKSNEKAELLMRSFELGVKIMEESYPDNCKLTYKEV